MIQDTVRRRRSARKDKAMEKYSTPDQDLRQMLLPRRAQPLPWEGLASLISRVSQRMGYDDPGWLLHPENHAYHFRATEVLSLSHQSDYQAIGQLLGLEEEAVYMMTQHSIAHSMCTTTHDNLSSLGYPLLSKGAISAVFLASPVTKVCPGCLQEPEGYDPLYCRLRVL